MATMASFGAKCFLNDTKTWLSAAVNFNRMLMSTNSDIDGVRVIGVLRNEINAIRSPPTNFLSSKKALK